jgi:hypothetical protein
MMRGFLILYWSNTISHTRNRDAWTSNSAGDIGVSDHVADHN